MDNLVKFFKIAGCLSVMYRYSYSECLEDRDFDDSDFDVGWGWVIAENFGDEKELEVVYATGKKGIETVVIPENPEFSEGELEIRTHIKDSSGNYLPMPHIRRTITRKQWPITYDLALNALKGPMDFFKNRGEKLYDR
jgi:hypothetical protein